MFHPRLYRGRDRVFMLREAHAGAIQRVGADQEQAPRAGEGRGERVGPFEIRLAHGDAERGQVGERRRFARGGDDLARRHLQRLQQMIQDAAAEMAGGAGHEDGTRNETVHGDISLFIDGPERGQS